MTKKNMNIELIRIISMLMIVYHHFSVHTSWNFPEKIGLRMYFITAVGNFGKIGVILFILITGYYLKKQNFSLNKICKLSNTIRVYSLGIFIISLSWASFSQDKFIKGMFPLVFDQYWFVTVYVILLIFQPILKNFLLENSREYKLKVALIMIVFFYVPTYLGFIVQIERHFVPNLYLVFILVALIGDLINEYEEELKTIYFKYVLSLFLITLFFIQNKVLITELFAKNHLDYPGFLINGTESLNAIIFSFSLFIIILKIRIPQKMNNQVLFVSVTTFEIYLIHDNLILRSIIWNGIFDASKYYWSKSLFVVSIIEPLVVFATCMMIVRVRVLICKWLKNNKLTSKITRKNILMKGL